MAYFDPRHEISAHTPGTPKGEERVRREGREPGREDARKGRTARDSTSVCPELCAPIDPRMPNMPPP
jgi:hypothetical protein